MRVFWHAYLAAEAALQEVGRRDECEATGDRILASLNDPGLHLET